MEEQKDVDGSAVQRESEMSSVRPSVSEKENFDADHLIKIDDLLKEQKGRAEKTRHYTCMQVHDAMILDTSRIITLEYSFHYAGESYVTIEKSHHCTKCHKKDGDEIEESNKLLEIEGQKKVEAAPFLSEWRTNDKGQLFKEREQPFIYEGRF